MALTLWVGLRKMRELGIAVGEDGETVAGLADSLGIRHFQLD
jgi:hypothetical protein